MQELIEQGKACSGIEKKLILYIYEFNKAVLGMRQSYLAVIF